MEKQITFINARLIDPKVEMETAGTLTINGGLIDKKNDGIKGKVIDCKGMCLACLLYTSPSPRDQLTSRMPSSA